MSVSLISKRKTDPGGESQQFVQSTLDALDGLIVILDDEGTILNVNAGWCEFADYLQWGYQNYGQGEKYLAVCESAIIEDKEEAQKAAQGIRKVLNGEQDLFSMEYACHIFGEQNWFRMKVTRLRKQPEIGAIVSHVNITDFKQFESSLFEGELKYRILFDSAADAIFLMQGDCFVDCNPSTLTMFGYTREQIINQTPYRFSPERQPDGRDSKEKALAYIQAALEGKSLRFEWTHIKADGTPFEAEVRLKRIDLQGQPHLLASVRDISERKRTENERALNESRLTALLELSQKAHELREQDIIQYTLEEAVRLTGSQIGYLHFVNPDQDTIQLVTWSEKTYEYCSIVYDSHYPLDQAGVWADCVRTGEPVIHNDYHNLPDKKGYPQGHADLIRHASIPIFDKEKIAIILGVGNKNEDYDATDILQMVLIGNQLVRILERKRSENDLRIKDSAIASAINAVAISNLEGSLDYINDAFLKMWGYEHEDEVLGRPATDFWAYLDRTNEVITALQNQTSWMGEVIGLKKADTPFDAQLSTSLVRNESGEPVSMMYSFIDITEQKRAERDLRNANLLLAKRLTEIEELQNKLREQAIRDPLTGLFNRRYLEENLIQAIARADRYQYPISLVMIDIDHFKVVNDTYGHKAGDQMLIALSELLCNQTRKGDTICRYGGEEFVVMMPRASWEIAVQRADQWRLAFQELQVPYDGANLNTTLSAGITMISTNVNTIDEAMREADIALYRSKTEGRNRVTVSDKIRSG